ncbi:hypothetical protein DSUL_170002 [Desulfovibrionales bacterium]
MTNTLLCLLDGSAPAVYRSMNGIRLKILILFLIIAPEIH